MEMPQMYHPVPRRAFEITPASVESSKAPSPLPEPQNPDRLGAEKWPEPPATPGRTRSILNLTSSTLLGIYSKTTTDGPGESISTPWGTGAQTPDIRRSFGMGEELRADLLAAKLSNDAQTLRAAMKKRRRGFWKLYLPLFLQTAMLFGSGMAFGMLVTHLQRTQQIAPLPVPTVARTSRYYQFAWGLLGVLIGNALPRIDMMLKDEEALIEADMEFKKPKIIRARSSVSKENEPDRRSLADSGIDPFWHSTVRSIGAFVGIAFAVRRIPWQSTLQVSLTLAIANPVLWYLIDRSKAGFALSTAVGVVGSFLLLLVNPNFVPVPAIHQDQVSEQFGVYTWLASILFCTSLCFGAIGRKLQL